MLGANVGVEYSNDGQEQWLARYNSLEGYQQYRAGFDRNILTYRPQTSYRDIDGTLPCFVALIQACCSYAD